MDITTSIRELFNERAQMYTFFSQVFLRELSAEALATLEQSDWQQPKGCNEQLGQGYAMLRRFFAFCESDIRTQLAVEYARIFLSAGVYTQKRLVAAPYESVFTSPEHLMMQEARDDVYRIFLRDGFIVNRSLHEPEDHLAFELEYLAVLSLQSIDRFESGDSKAFNDLAKRQTSFITAHLLNWIPALRDAAARYAQSAFYPGMLLIVEGYLRQDIEYLEELGAQADGGEVSAAAEVARPVKTTVV